ncbi:MAG: hypothetical protein KTR28_04315 [Micavibrio sp.]|nr:hypothetical protein [Micavibrio sp.]
MREPIDKILQKLGVARPLAAYEAQPWFLHDEDKGMTCSAEVRMGPGARDAEAEIQLLKDELDADEESGAEGREQVLFMRFEPLTGDLWSPKVLRVRGEDFYNAFFDWEGKGCKFFKLTIEALQMGEIPDFEAMADANMVDDSEKGGGRRGRIGRKSPSAKNAIGMKR